MMEYKGYFAGVTFDAENDIFHGEVVGIRDVITFSGQFGDGTSQGPARVCGRLPGVLPPAGRVARQSTFWPFYAPHPARTASGRLHLGLPRPGRASTPGSRHAWPGRWNELGCQPRDKKTRPGRKPESRKNTEKRSAKTGNRV